MFTTRTILAPVETMLLLFQYCDKDLGNSFPCSHPNATKQSKQNLLELIKRTVVTPLAISVNKSDLLPIQRDHGENSSFLRELLVHIPLNAVVPHVQTKLT